MTALIQDHQIPSTLDALPARLQGLGASRAEVWLFEDEPRRRAAEREWRVLGLDVRVRSAYKPLLHFFLEEAGPLQDLREIAVHAPAEQLQRIKVDAYPLAGLLGEQTRLSFVADTEIAISLDGRRQAVFAPLDASGSPIGWLRAWRGNESLHDGPWQTDYETVFEQAMAAVRGHAWPATEPYFDTLQIDVAIRGIERGLDYGDEVISTAEALHEDLYFSILEHFQRHSGKPPGDRTLRPGQIVPHVVRGDGPATLSVRLLTHRADAQAEVAAPALERLERPLHPDEVRAAFAPLAGERFACKSWQGRQVQGLHRAGSLPGVVISGGQHANESSGIVAVLRAGAVLQQRPDAHYALVPLENPDGATLHHLLCQSNPRHMQHAARYTALGDDLEVRQPPGLGEKAARQEAITRTQAGLHLSLHGYPAHEWTRPFSGYLPRGMPDWALPKGFFLILRQHPGHDGRAFLEALTAGLAQDPALRALMALNARQHALWRAHWGELPFPVLNGIACLISEDQRSRVPFTLITEYPDETVYGEAFVLAHETLTRTVLLATELYWQGLLGQPRLSAG
nr:hypothetical protein [uncultured Roseateles sp.]